MIRSRVLIALAVIVGALAVGSPAVADPSPAPTPTDDCVRDIYGDNPSGVTARIAGAPVTGSIVVHNPDAYAMKGMDVVVKIGMSSTSSPGPLPSVDWNSDGGSWHHVSVHFTAATSSDESHWISSSVAAPTFAAHSQHTLRIRIAFAKSTAPGDYSVDFSFSTSDCPSPDLVGSISMGNDAPLVTIHTAAHNNNPIPPTPTPTTAVTSIGIAPGPSPSPKPTSTATPSPAPAPDSGMVMQATALALPGEPIAAGLHTRTFRIDTGVGVATLFVLLSLVQLIRWRRFRAERP